MAKIKKQYDHMRAYRDRQRLLKIKAYVALINKILCQVEKEKKLTTK